MTKGIKNLFKIAAITLLSISTPGDDSALAKINNYIEDIKHYIIAAKQEAKKFNKHALIIVGEDHRYTPHSLYSNAIIQQTASTQGIGVRYVEAKPYLLELILNRPRKVKTMSEEYLVPIAQQDLGMKVIGIENPNIPTKENLSLEEEDQRENYMIKKISQENTDAILITGGVHIKAFTECPELNAKYAIVSFTAITTLGKIRGVHSDRNQYNMTSERVVRLAPPNELTNMPRPNFFYFLLGKTPHAESMPLIDPTNLPSGHQLSKSSSQPHQHYPTAANAIATEATMEEKLAIACKTASQDKDSGPHIYSGKGPYDTAMRTRCNFSTGRLNPSAG